MKWAQGSSTGVLVAGGNGIGYLNTQLNSPYGIVVDETTNVMYISNFVGQSVIKWSIGASNGAFVLGSSGTSGSNSTLFNNPS
ncbi:unnamed protein product, partial [Didymodactylos carnosus]